MMASSQAPVFVVSTGRSGSTMLSELLALHPDVLGRNFIWRPGAEVTVGTESGGTVVNLPVVEKASVRKGDLLVEFQADDQKAALLDASYCSDCPMRSWAKNCRRTHPAVDDNKLGT